VKRALSPEVEPQRLGVTPQRLNFQGKRRKIEALEVENRRKKLGVSTSGAQGSRKKLGVSASAARRSRKKGRIVSL
jgi:hypothetical protein